MSGASVIQSRLTFRSAAGDVAWQKQLRDRYEAEGAPPVPHLDVKRAIVRPVSRKLAAQIILKYEWLGTMPNCNYFYGIFFGPYCAGVACVGVGGGGANVYAYKEFGLKNQGQFAYLMRGANVHWSPTGANSRLVSWTCRLLTKQSDAKIIIAYSDTDAGEIGTIYQACNWVCVGKGHVPDQWVAPNGRIYDHKYASNLAKKRGVPRAVATRALKDAGWQTQRANPKYRYVYVLDKSDKALVDRVECMRQPYPKRAAEVTPGDTSGVQPEEGGSRPTRPLESVEALP